MSVPPGALLPATENRPLINASSRGQKQGWHMPWKLLRHCHLKMSLYKTTYFQTLMTLCSPLYNFPVVKSDRFTVDCVKLKGQSLIQNRSAVCRQLLQFFLQFSESLMEQFNQKRQNAVIIYFLENLKSILHAIKMNGVFNLQNVAKI